MIRWRRSLALMLTSCTLLSAYQVGFTPVSAAEISPAVAACVTKAIGSAAQSLMSGGDRAMARLSAAHRARVDGCLLTEGRSAGPAAKLPPSLTVSPMDPSVVTSMSRFRSCGGHDFSGLNVAGKPERDRSMKHYLYVDQPWTATGSIPVRAPITGTAIVSVEEDYPLGSWVRILSSKGWEFTAFHVDPTIRDGQKVSAGQQIAVFPPANAPAFMPERMSEPQANFDFSLQSTDGRLASFLDWMTPAARSAWEDRGFTPSAMTVSREQRNAQPCPPDYPDGPGSNGFVSARP
jgi:hypothetical protein